VIPKADLLAQLETVIVETTKVLPAVTANPAVAPTRELRRSSEEFVVGAALGPDSNGSLDHLLATFSKLRKTGRLAKLVIFAAPDTQQLASKAAIQELRPNLQWVPDELSTRDLLQGCDVLVSLQDGVPPLVLRAMSSRIPIITTAVRIPEALRNLRTVKFIRHGDRHGLQEALLRLSEQPKRKPILGFVSEERIAKYYSDSYLWRENGSPSAIGQEPKGHALMKRALFGAVPGRQRRRGVSTRTGDRCSRWRGRNDNTAFARTATRRNPRSRHTTPRRLVGEAHARRQRLTQGRCGIH